MNDFINKLNKCFDENNLSQYTSYAESFYTLSQLLAEYNEKVNLTAITDETGIIEKHFADSLTVCRFIPNGAKIIDVGAGGGFPSLPIAITRPDAAVTALDATTKKLAFIDYAARELGLKNISTLNQRAEEAARDPAHRERYDAVTARAVARLNILCELCLPLAAPGGKFIAMKGENSAAEISEAESAIRTLGGVMAEKITGNIKGEKEIMTRNVIVIQKLSPTPKNYPRDYSRINKKPL